MEFFSKEKAALKAAKAAEKLAKKVEALRQKAQSVGVAKAVKETVVKEVKAAKVSLPKAKKSLGFLAKTFLVGNSKGKISKFYSNKNFAIVEKLVDQDFQLLRSPEFAPSSNDRLAFRGQASTANSGLLTKLESLNFFNLHKELSSQIALKSEYPSVIANKVTLERFNTLSSQLASLEQEVRTVYNRKHLEAHLNERLSKVSKDITVFKEINHLIK
jgi:hypothetical protein